MSNQLPMRINLANTLLDEDLHEQLVSHFVLKTKMPEDYVETQLDECLRYLYLVSKYPAQLGGLFLPVEQAIDEIWHYLILQTREYKALCMSRLPGRYFIHHRSTPFSAYSKEPRREDVIEESLRWLPLYRAEFGSFSEKALPHWTMVRFMHEQMGLSLQQIAEIDATAPA
jgi:hypothetical protein